MVDIPDYNRAAWDRQVEAGNKWTVPVTPDQIAAALKIAEEFKVSIVLRGVPYRGGK